MPCDLVPAGQTAPHALPVCAPDPPPDPVADPLALLLADTRSPATRAGYAKDLRDLFAYLSQGRDAGPSPKAVAEFVAQPASRLAYILTTYKAAMQARGLGEATVNRRLTAARALLRFCHRLGLAACDGNGLVPGEKYRAYRDTRGVDLDTLARLVAAPGTDTLRGLRDTALLHLLAENALRRAEVCALDVGDFRPDERRLFVAGKGRGTQKEAITLSPRCADAIDAYLEVTGHGTDPNGSLFRNLDHRPGYRGRRLTVDGLYTIVTRYGERLGVRLTVHCLRHSAITAALDITGGDIRGVQRLSRHADVRTVMIYDDCRRDRQGEISRAISERL